MADAVVIDHLSKSYGRVEAVKDISFSVAKGEIFGFLGPNGAGKTSTINCITGLSTITSGRVSVCGKDVVEEYIFTRKKIGLSPQEFQFDVYFTVRNMLLFQGGYFGMRKRAAQRRADELLEEFGMAGKAKDTIRALSGGMKRRLSLAKAMMHDPEVLILDEPTAGLDVDLRVELWGYLKRLKKRRKTIILTTHYIEEAERLADKIGIMHKGNMLMVRKTADIIKELGDSVIAVKAAKNTLPSGLEGKREKGVMLFWNTPVSDVIAAFQREKNTILSLTQENENLEKIFVRLTQ